MKVLGGHRTFVNGVEAFYKVQMHVLKVTKVWVRASRYMGKCDRMCVSPWMLNFCMNEVVIKLNVKIANEEVKVRVKNGYGMKV